MHQYLYICTVPCLLFYKDLVKDFEDPSGYGRIPVILNFDGTYFDIQRSSDLELQKYLYYTPRSGHTVKFLSLAGSYFSVSLIRGWVVNCPTHRDSRGG